MEWQKKGYKVLTDQQDIINCQTIKRILNHIWVPLSTIGFTGVESTVREFINGLDRWGERGCGTSQIVEAIAQFEHDAGQARTQAMGNRFDPTNT